VYATGSYSDIVRFGIAEIPYLLPLHIAVFPRTLALFLLGLWAWRSGVLRNVGAHKTILLAVAAIGLACGSALTIAEATNAMAALSSLGNLRGAIQNCATVLLAVGFAAGVIALAEFSEMKRPLSFFAPIGRMAFTSYIMQSLVFALVFFGYGLGQFGQHGPAAAFGFGVLVFTVQCFTSAWWLRRYRFGPLEWLWRTLMYGQRQAMVRLPPGRGNTSGTAPGLQ
jgi:uncharacterized protein